MRYKITKICGLALVKFYEYLSVWEAFEILSEVPLECNILKNACFYTIIRKLVLPIFSELSWRNVCLFNKHESNKNNQALLHKDKEE